MIAGLKPYAEMKDSGVEWLGAVPAHWDVRRLKYLLRERDTRSEKGEEQLLRVSQYTGITERKRDDGAEGPDTRAASLVGYKVVDRSDLAVNIMLAWNGSLGVSPYDGIVSPAYGVYRFNPGIEPMFFHHLLRSPTYKARIKTASRGVVESRLRLYTDDLYRIEALLPPIGEQTAIVRFLDHVDRRIRRAIAVKQKLIRLLEEQKRVIIHRAVTRGLDPDVRLKPSGVEWLGDVPDHWNVTPLKFLTHRIQNGNTPSTSQPEFYEDGIVPWYGPSSFARSEFADEPVRYLSEAAFNAGRARLIRAPALFIVVIGATAGRMALLAQNGSTNQQITAFELRADLVFPRFGLHQMRCSESWLRSTASTATIPILDSGLVARLPIAIPSLNEQMEIMRSIDRSIAPQTDEIERAFREIDLLSEYRIRLIADVVTGKLDVREAATNLPEMIELADNDFDSGEENEESMEAVTAEDQAA